MTALTTSLFFHGVKRTLQGAPRPVPPNVVSLSVSPDGLHPVAMPATQAPMPVTPQYVGQAYVSPDPKRPDVETIPLGSKANAITTQGFDLHSTSEEKAGAGNPRSAPASLVGGL